MKLLLTALSSFLLSTGLLAQAPGQINYQGVARNSFGVVIPNQSITVRLTIHNGTTNGTAVYAESRTVKTNTFGLFTIGIGSTGATTSTGSLAGIDWSTGGDKFLEVEMDPTGGTSYVKMGVAQLLSVPYSFYAGSALPAGQAGGSLTGSYPNPGIAANTITSLQIKDSSITPSKLAVGFIPTTLPPSGNAGGDLSGTYPNPVIGANAVTTAKILDGSVTAAKLAAGTIPAALPPSGNAGGDLGGTYPNPTVNTNAITTTKIADGSVTAAKLAVGIIPSALPPSGNAGGDLSGTYPNPTVSASAITTTKIADGSVTAAKLAVGIIPSALPPSGNAGGDLGGTYPNPTVNTNAITTTKIADGAVGTTKIADASVTAVKLAAGIIPSALPPSGNAGGDLGGTYPNPTVNTNAITTTKIADGAVGTTKIADASVTAVKLASGVIPSALPPSGNAGGDLSGTYPNPSVTKLQGNTVSNTAPVTGQVLKYNGATWAPGNDSTGAFALPYSYSGSNAANLLSITNSGAATAVEGINSSVNAKATGIIGQITATAAGDSSVAVRGKNNSTSTKGLAVWGSHNGGGTGVYGTAVSGTGVNGYSKSGTGVIASTVSGTGIIATSNDGIAGEFDITNTNSSSAAVTISNQGYGNGLESVATYGTAIFGTSNDANGQAVIGINVNGGAGIIGYTASDLNTGILGINDGTNAAIKGYNTANSGVGIYALANSNGAVSGNALVAEIEGGQVGNPAVFVANGANVARIDQNGKAFFNGGTQVGGADVAEYFDVEGSSKQYEAGDVLVISQQTDRTVEKSSTPYSTLISGVYATKPGLSLTEKNAEQNALANMVPMGVIGVLPTKVCLEGGNIKRGDLIVTSSLSGVAMKGDPEKIKVGQVLGKALQDFNSNSTGIIKVLVSVK